MNYTGSRNKMSVGKMTSKSSNIVGSDKNSKIGNHDSGFYGAMYSPQRKVSKAHNSMPFKGSRG